jgi:predicted Zn-dependent protease
LDRRGAKLGEERSVVFGRLVTVGGRLRARQGITLNALHLGDLGDVRKRADRYDLRALLAHELGHALGLDEEQTNERSLMWPTVGRGDHDREFQPSDLRSVRRLYRGRTGG